MDILYDLYDKYTKELKLIDDKILSYKKETQPKKMDAIYDSIIKKITKLKNKLVQDTKFYVKNNDIDSLHTKECFLEKLILVNQNIDNKLGTLNKILNQKKSIWKSFEQYIIHDISRNNLIEDDVQPAYEEKYENNVQLLDDVDIKEQQKNIMERHKNIKEIEHDMIEISELFTEMKVLIDYQREDIDSIETNTNNTKEYVEKGGDEVNKSHTYQSKTVCLIS
jgi:t-SNARE complex subunit (syntaxin)